MVARGARSLSLFSFVICRLLCSRDRGGLNLRRLRHWRDPAIALALSCSFALGVPQYDAPQVCTVFSHGPSENTCSTFQFVSALLGCSGCFSCFSLFSVLLICWIFLCQVVPGFVWLLWEVLPCVSWFKIVVLQKSFSSCLLEVLAGLGSLPLFYGMLPFVCKTFRSRSVVLFGFALFWTVQEV